MAKFGFGEGPKFVKVFKNLKEFFIISGFSYILRPSMTSVVQVGSSAKSSLYSFVLKCLTSLCLITN